MRKVRAQTRSKPCPKEHAGTEKGVPLLARYCSHQLFSYADLLRTKTVLLLCSPRYYGDGNGGGPDLSTYRFEPSHPEDYTALSVI